MRMAEEDFSDAELWAAIDTAAAAARYAPGSAAAAHHPPASDRSLVLARSHSHRPALVELPSSPQTEPPKFSRMAALGRSPPENAPSGHKRQQQQMQLQEEFLPLPVRQKPNNHSQLRPFREKSPAHEFSCQELMSADPNWGHQNPAAIQSMLSPWIGGIPSSSVFRHLQDAAMKVLEKGDYIMMQGKPFIRKSGWRKLAFFFNISFEIKDRKIEFDQAGAVIRSEFVIRATMQSGRFSDGWGSCDAREKRFSKPNHDIPSTAETRAKTRACQDLLGIGEYKPSSENW